jgi:hypothetical protein
MNGVSDPSCSPRAPMFWRLHKALDDVVRVWQDGKAVDVMHERAGFEREDQARSGARRRGQFCVAGASGLRTDQRHRLR